MNWLQSRFPELSPEQHQQLLQLEVLLREWNEKINLVSRQDTDNLMPNHIGHCLAMCKFTGFEPGTRLIDVGSGGGLPGLPLAICFPEAEFTLLDSTAKKMKAAQAMADELGLKNLKTVWARAEEHKGSYHFVLGRGVSTLDEFWKAVRHLLNTEEQFNAWENGVLYLKGGNLTEELKALKKLHIRAKVFALSKLMPDEFFETKALVHFGPPRKTQPQPETLSAKQEREDEALLRRLLKDLP